MMKKKKQKSDNLIILNKKAKRNYFIIDSYEAGVSLLGWEVKSLRQKKVGLGESYVILKNNELFLFNANITPENTASTHVDSNHTRTRKLLMHRAEIHKIKEQIEQKGGTAVPLKLYWQRGKVKLEVGLAFGKKMTDKRQDIKTRDWQREKGRELKNRNR